MVVRIPTKIPKIRVSDDIKEKDDSIFSPGARTAFGAVKAILSVPFKPEARSELKTSLRSGILSAGGAIERTASQLFRKISKDRPFGPVEDPRPQFIKDIASQVSDRFGRIADKDFELAKVGIDVQDKRKFSEAIQDPVFVARGIGQNAPNLIGAIGVGILGTAIAGPAGGVAGAFGFASALEGGFAFEEARNFGLSEDEASAVMVKVGIANGILETIPVSRFLNRTGIGKRVKKRIFRRIARDIIQQGGEEAVTEGLQEIVSNAVAQSYDENRDLLENVPESVYFGGLLGLGVGGAGAVRVRGLEIEDVSPIPEELKPLAEKAKKFETTTELQKSIIEYIEATELGQRFGFETPRAFYESEAKQGGAGLIRPKLFEVFDGKDVTDILKKNFFTAQEEGGPTFITKELTDAFFNQVKGVEKPVIKPTPTPEVKGEEVIEEKKPRRIIPRELRAEVEFAETAQEFEERVSITPELRELVNEKFGSVEEFFTEEKAKIEKKLIRAQKAKKLEEPEDIGGLIDREGELLSFSETVKNIEQTAIDKEIEPFSAEDLDQVKLSFQFLKDSILAHPARKLAKFADKNNELPEVTGEGKSIFGRRGDDIVTELGFSSTEEARNSFQEYVARRDEFNKAQQELREDVKKARSFRDLQNAKDKLIRRADVAKTSLEKASIQTLKNTITKELQASQAKVNKQGIKVGIFDAETQKKLTDMLNITKEDRSKALVKISDNIQRHAGPEGSFQDMPESVIAENELLNMAGIAETKGASELGVDGLEKVLDDIRSVKETGRTKRELKRFNKATEIQRTQEKYTSVISGGQGLKPGTSVAPEEATPRLEGLFSQVKNYLDGHRGLDYQLEFLARLDETSEPLDSAMHQQTAQPIHDARREQNKGIRELTEKWHNKFAEVYGVPTMSKQFYREFKAQSDPNIEITFTDFQGRTVTRKMNRFQLRKKWMELQDKSLASTFEIGMNWDSNTISQIGKNMSGNDIEFARWQLETFYPEYRETINPVYEDLYGVSMGKIKNYSPIKRDVSVVVPEYIQNINDLVRKTSTKPGSIKARHDNITPLQFVGDLQVLQQHIAEMEHFKAYSQVISDTRRIFSGDVKQAVFQYHGKEIMKNIDKAIDDVASDGVKSRENFNWLDTFRGNFVISTLGLNPTIMFKQLTSIPAYLVEMPSIPWFKGVADFWTAPREKAKILLESETLKARYSLGAFDRDVKLAFKRGSDAKKLSGKAGYREQIMSLVRLGDRGAILAGGWPVYKYHLEQQLKAGKTQEEAKVFAMKKFEGATKRTQQAGDPEDLGSIQRGGSFMKLFTTYMTTPFQYWRIVEASTRNLGLFQKFGGSVKRGTRAGNLKNIFIMWVVLPTLFQFVADGFEWKEKRQKRAVILGPLGFPLIIGDAFESIIRFITKDDVFSDTFTPSALSAMTDLTKASKNAYKLLDEDTTGEDVFEVVEDMMISMGRITGVPVKQFDQFLRGSAKLISGETFDPRPLIYSEYAIGDPKKKEKKKTTVIPGVRIPTIKIPSVRIKVPRVKI